MVDLYSGLQHVDLQVFGWDKNDVEGKNVSMLMPPPFSQMHNSFLRAYADSGVANILNTTREVQGLHMDRYSFPIKIAITKVPQSGTGLPMYTLLELFVTPWTFRRLAYAKVSSPTPACLPV